jgi:hypothetical protein
MNASSMRACRHPSRPYIKVGKLLRAGTNCGFCLSEWKRIIADERTA